MKEVPFQNQPLDDWPGFTPSATVRASRRFSTDPPSPICVLDFDGVVTPLADRQEPRPLLDRMQGFYATFNLK